MTVAQINKMQKIASESATLAKKAIKKSNELEALISLSEYKSGKVNSYKSVNELFRKLKR